MLACERKALAVRLAVQACRFDCSLEDRTGNHRRACARQQWEGQTSPTISPAMQGSARISLAMNEMGLRQSNTPPPMHQQEPALKAGFLLPEISCRCGISRGFAGAARARNTAGMWPGSPPFSSLFSTCPRQPAAVGTGRTLVVVRGNKATAPRPGQRHAALPGERRVRRIAGLFSAFSASNHLPSRRIPALISA